MKILPSLKKLITLSFLVIFAITLLTSARRSNCKKPRPLSLTSVHIVDRNGFSETISNPDRLQQFLLVDFLKPQPYQKALRIYARDSKGNVRSIVTSYHDNGNVKQLLELVNGRALGNYREWHENGNLRISSRVIGGTADITQAAEQTWLFDGLSNVWDEDGHLIAEIPYSQGSLEGVSTNFHPNSQVWKKIPYHKGVVEGIVEIYRETGELLQQISYSQGNKHGLATRYWDANQIASQETYSEGKLINGQYFDKKGTLISEVKQGTGYRATFGKECLNELQEYKDGLLDGEVKIFSSQGRLKRLYHIKDGIKHGEEIEFDDQRVSCSSNEPQPKLSFYWYDGKVHGITKTWYSNGCLESQKEISNNKKQGLSTAWYQDNNLMMIEEYDQGNLVKGDYFKKGEKNPFSQVIQGKGTVTIFDGMGHFIQKISYVNGKPGNEG